MGLDITAYSKLTLAVNPEMKDGELVDYDNHFTVSPTIIAWTEQNWPKRTEGVLPGIYTFADCYGFRAGSCSGYNRWREWLAAFAGHGTPDAVWKAENASGPFVELIDFADNEGVIGPVVAAKLAKDFADHQARAEQFMGGQRDYWLARYADWRKAFELAADGGAVDFH